MVAVEPVRDIYPSGMDAGDGVTDADIAALSDEELLRLYAAVMGEMMARSRAARPEQWGPSED